MTGRIALTEAELQSCVWDLAKRAGWMIYHVRDSRRSPAGFPDLTLVHRFSGRLLFVELKSPKGRIRPEQAEWLAALGARHEIHVWRPDDWHSGDIQALLLGEREAAA